MFAPRGSTAWSGSGRMVRAAEPLHTTTPVWMASFDSPPFADLLRVRLDREHELLMHRTNWVVGTQAFLFSVYAIALNDRAFARMTGTATRSGRLIAVLPWTAISSLVLFYVAILAAVGAMVHLRRHVPPSDPRSAILDGAAFFRAAGLAAPLLIPGVFLVSWLVLLAEP